MSLPTASATSLSSVGWTRQIVGRRSGKNRRQEDKLSPEFLAGDPAMVPLRVVERLPIAYVLTGQVALGAEALQPINMRLSSAPRGAERKSREEVHPSNSPGLATSWVSRSRCHGCLLRRSRCPPLRQASSRIA